MFLLDSDILIDYLRLYQPSLDFFQGLLKRDHNIAFLSQFELLQGCRSKEQAHLMNRFFKRLNVFSITPAVHKTAWNIFQAYHFQTKIDISDSFIAATAMVHKCTLLTRNLKHYEKIGSLKLEKPYD